jgi:ferrous-iron efflux pump FieF
VTTADVLNPATPGPTLSGEAATKRNVRVARLSVCVAFGLGVLKLAAAILTGSLSILASLVDSVMDVLASLVNYFAIRLAGRPADAEHRYGHGKVEALAGLVQTVVVGFSGIFLLGEGVRRLVQGVGVEHTEIGIGVMAISTVASVWVTWRLRAAARATGSVALAADAFHYASDVWTNLGVLGALVAIRFTGWAWLDGTVAVLVSAVVLGTAVRVLQRSAAELMDESLAPKELQGLVRTVRSRVPEVRGLHNLRTRRAGPTVFVDCHIELDRGLSFVEAHRLTERVRRAFEELRPGALVYVHTDPYPLLPGDLDPDSPEERREAADPRQGAIPPVC